MRYFANILSVSVGLVALLLPAAGFAATWTHSWCTPGAALELPPPTGTDANIAKVVSWVCGEGGRSDCCASNGRWTMECVQRGAAKAKKESWSISGTTDYCGRYAWAQGPIGNSEQYYPRDFNLFAWAEGQTTFGCVQGPIAAAGKVSASGFNLSGGRQEYYGLIGKGDLALSNGTIWGAVVYGGTYNPPATVTNLNPSIESAPPVAPTKNAGLIDFSAASSKLVDMSKALARFTATTVRPSNGQVTFAGSDPDLNVFTVATSSGLSNATSFVFNVPSTSSVIINVTGTSVVIKNAGFSGPNGGGLASIPVPMNRIMWNFPDATLLLLQSVGVPGSVLAPNAVANIRWGSLTGTIVVKSADVSSELYMARYQTPAPGGCLWDETTWSCANDTTLDDGKHAASIAPEAGFIEIEGGQYTAESATRTSPTHRIWYSFQPALYVPKQAPLAVLFNGGPGLSTSALLFSFNTGTWTLDRDVAGDGKTAYNVSSWTKFANLLYVDAPGTGFSYPLPWNGSPRDVGIDIDRDAGAFLRFLVEFLLHHPALLDNRVIVAGESYGGTRATLMLSYLYNYQSLRSDSGAAYRDEQLRKALMERYFQTVFGTQEPSIDQIGTRFRHQILIQPGVVGQDQQDHRTWTPVGCLSSQCWLAGVDPVTKDTIPPTCSQYDCDKANAAQPDQDEWLWFKSDKAAESLNMVANLNKTLGVDARTIKWMKREERVNAHGRSGGFSSAEMNTNFGQPLATDDRYFVALNFDVGKGYGYPSSSRDWTESGADIGKRFVANVFDFGVSTFITVTKFDAMIWSPSIALALEGLGANVDLKAQDGAVYSSTLKTSVQARPGAMSLTHENGALKTVTMPTSYAAGHTISMRGAASGDPGPAGQLLTDVTQWYVGSPH